MSLFVSTGCGSQGTHTSLYHATSALNIVPCKSTMKKHIVQRHNAGIVPMVKKRAQYTAHSAHRHRPKAQICRNYPWGGPVAPEKLPPENRGQKRDRRGPWFEGLNEGVISAKLWQMRALWSMRSTSQSAGANVTNGWTDWHTTVCFQMYTFRPLSPF